MFCIPAILNRFTHIGLNGCLAGLLGMMLVNSGCGGGETSATPTCSSGEVKVEGVCRRACYRNSHCRPGSTCDPKFRACFPAPTAKPSASCDPNGDDCHRNGECVVSDQGSQCVCLSGFLGDGREDCRDIDECDQDTGPCGDGRDCVNTAGSYACVCQDDNACPPAACDDGIKNGDETGTDCGGSCQGCKAGDHCSSHEDCLSHVCTGGACQSPICSDEVKNGDETDTDCGGSCPHCADDAHCGGAGDCRSGVCAHGTCQKPTCSDSVRNGNETDTDCGGACTVCNPFKPGQDWTGSYTCPQGLTNLRLEITNVSGNKVTAIFHFQYSKTGSYYVSGTFNGATGRLVMTPGEWINRPDLIINTVGMDGAVNAAGTIYSGNIAYEACGSFTVKLK